MNPHPLPTRLPYTQRKRVWDKILQSGSQGQNIVTCRMPIEPVFPELL